MCLSLCRPVASVTRGICRSSACCAASASSCVWPPLWPWSGPASKWPKSFISSSCTRSYSLPWGETLRVCVCVCVCCLPRDVWKRADVCDKNRSFKAGKQQLKHLNFSPHYSECHLPSLTQNLGDITDRKYAHNTPARTAHTLTHARTAHTLTHARTAYTLTRTASETDV